MSVPSAPVPDSLGLGGGPGRYAIWLAGQGLAVTLADLSPSLLDLACELIAGGTTGPRNRPGDARDLGRP
jgi:2-polyprenyl-3-methyl-5-hydroxy-6-metoxy-1,4-benzoquinol methylase